MKNFLIAISFVFVVNNISAQNKNTAKADKLFKQFEYIAAAKTYLALDEKEMTDGYVYKQLGDCYYNVFNWYLNLSQFFIRFWHNCIFFF